ncbi:MAG: bifunctional diaminohydroxyphosphoribosylaminopyrimidine deaminase/5-amino-6-(5-phosphoribosylamino)uracil reductase RibD [Thermodesulforhabdaceae bacterium]
MKRGSLTPDEVFMREALRLAKKGMGRVSPNPMVGAVVVNNGVIVGRGFHEAVGEAHAEVNALKNAGDAAIGATLYVNLEPCNHYGRTPPCTEAILKAGIKKVVIGMKDPNPHVTGGGAQRLRREGVEVVEGVLENECRYLNRAFIKHVTTGLPYIIAKAAMTLDGKIACRTGHSRWITGEASRRFAHQLRSEVDAICVGIGTVLADDPLLTVRLKTHRSGRHPIRVVIDSKLRIPEDCQLVRTASDVPCWVFHESDVSSKKVKKLEASGVKLFPVSTLDNGRLNLREVLERLGKEQVTSVLVEGGSSLMGSFFASSDGKPLVDEVCFFYAPKILADPKAMPLISSGGIICSEISEALRLKRLVVRRFEDDVLIRGILECSPVL